MKKILVILVSALIALTICGCGGSSDEEQTTETTQTTTKVAQIERSIDAVAEELGLIGKSEVYYTVIDAQDGAEFNDGTVELYMYEPESTTYQDIADGNGVINAVACNNGFILVVPDGSEADDSLISRFNELSIE